jgi:uncharacterized membrane protein
MVAAAGLMTALPGWHPFVVHFPLGLVLTAAPLFIAARLLRREALAGVAATVGTWNLCIGALAALFAMASGLGALFDLQVSLAARQAIALHMKWAMFSTLLLVLLAVWRGAGSAPESRPSWAFIIFLLAASTSLLVTSFRGADNVYRYGVGLEKIAVRSLMAPHGDLSKVLVSQPSPSASCRYSR